MGGGLANGCFRRACNAVWTGGFGAPTRPARIHVPYASMDGLRFPKAVQDTNRGLHPAVPKLLGTTNHGARSFQSRHI